MTELRKQVDTLSGQAAALALPYGDNHPILQQARRQRDEATAMLDQTAHSVAVSILSNYAAAKVTEDLLQKELERQEKTAVELDRIAIPYHALERDVQSDTALHAQILARVKETDVTQNLVAQSNFSDNYVHLIDAPFATSEPVRPVWYLALAAGLAGGGVIGVGLAALRLVFDDSVPSVDAAEACLGRARAGRGAALAPAWFPSRPSPPAGPGHNRHGGVPAPAHRAVDARRHRGPAVRHVYQRLPRRGQTCCAINYAAVVAQSGMRTLLIDGDLRRPKLRSAFERYVRKTTLSECLADPSLVESAIDGTDHPNLFSSPTPTAPPAPPSFCLATISDCSWRNAPGSSIASSSTRRPSPS
ncbi:MAG: GNVR domain-containing protein [Lacunisphaera sp.]